MSRESNFIRNNLSATERENHKVFEGQLQEAADQLKQLEGQKIVSTEIDEDHTAVITLEGGRRLTFVITDEDHLRVDNLHIENLKPE